MNMHGFMTPHVTDANVGRPSFRERAWTFLKARRYFLLLVILPVVLYSAYLYLVAADQYESESHFLVRSADDTAAVSGGGGLGSLLGFSAGGSSTAGAAQSIVDYLQSHDVVDALDRKLDLVKIFRRPEADPIAMLRGPHPTPERLLHYYQGQVTVKFVEDSGITSINVRAFRPEDAYQINKTLLQLGEQRVNEINVRSYNDALALARNQLADAERGVAQIQGRLTNFRQSRGDIDPEGSGEAQIHLVSSLQSNLAAARAQLAATRSLISTSSPQYVALVARVHSLEAEVAAQSAKLASANHGGTIAVNLGSFEDLKVRQEFAGKRYDAAAAALEKAREEARRQQLYVVRIVDPNLPVKSLYPKRGKDIVTLLLVLSVAYGIGWLLVAGVREHSV